MLPRKIKNLLLGTEFLGFIDNGELTAKYIGLRDCGKNEYEITFEFYFPHNKKLYEHYCLVDIVLTSQFPFISPKVIVRGFSDIFHPCINERDGRFCGNGIGYAVTNHYDQWSPAAQDLEGICFLTHNAISNPIGDEDVLNIDAYQTFQSCPELFYEMLATGMFLRETAKGKGKLVHT